MSASITDTAAEKALDSWNEILDTIEQRLIDSELDVHTDILEIVSKLLPKITSTTSKKVAEAIEIIHKVTMTSQLVVDDEIWRKCPTMMQLSRNRNTVNQTSNETFFYLRPMRFNKKELQDILDYYNKNYNDPLFCESWVNQINSGDNKQQSYYVRYVGCTTRSPYERYNEDLSATEMNNRGSRLFNFYRSVKAVFGKHGEQKLKAVMSIYEFKHLAVKRNSFSRENSKNFVSGGGINSQEVAYYTLVDNTEKILNHSFGREFLLNSQPDGYHASYLPSQKDINATLNSLPGMFFRVPNTDDQHQKNTTTHVQLQLENLFQNYADTLNGEIEQQQKYYIQKSHINLYVEGAITDTTHFQGVTPLVIFGKDNTKENFEAVRKFTHGSRTGVIVDNLIRKLISIQHVPVVLPAEQEATFSFIRSRTFSVALHLICQRVRINGRRVSEPSGIYWSEKINDGEYLITFDPEFTTNGLILKYKENSQAVVDSENSLYIATDLYLFVHSRSKYYQVYKKTLLLFSIEPRPELQTAEDEQIYFNPNRALRIVWREKCSRGPQTIYTTEGMPAEDRVLDIIQNVIGRVETLGLYRLLWQQEIDKGSNMFSRFTSAAFKKLAGSQNFNAARYAHTPVRGGGQKTG